MSFNPRVIQLSALTFAGLGIWLAITFVDFGDEGVHLEEIQDEKMMPVDPNRGMPTRSASSIQEDKNGMKATQPGRKHPLPRTPLKFDQGGDVTVIVKSKETGGPVSDMHVELRPREQLPTDLRPLLGITDRLGQVTFSSQPARMYDVTVIEGARSISLLVSKDKDAEKEITLSAFRLIHGQCVDENGENVSGATISVGSYIFGSWSRAEVAISDSEGGFSIPIFSHGAFLEARREHMAPAKFARVRDLQTGESNVRLVLGHKGARLSGIVTGEGLPICGACVSLSDTEQNMQPNSGLGDALTTLTDATGYFEFNNTREGEAILRVTDGTHADHTSRLTLKLQANEQDVDLVEGAIIRGKLTGPDGEKVAFSTVAATDANGLWRVASKSTQDGYFALSRVPPGVVILEIFRPFLGSARERYTVASGQALTWNPTYESPASIKGRVVFVENGKPVKGLKVTASLEGPRSLANYKGRSAKTDAEGHFELVHVETGDHKLKVKALQGAWQLSKAETAALSTVKPGQKDVVIRIPRSSFPTARVTGAIRSQKGDVINCYMLIQKPDDPNPEPNHSDGAGNSTFDYGPFVPGEYRIEVHSYKFGIKPLGTFRLGVDQRLSLGSTLMDEPGHANLKLDGINEEVVQELTVLLKRRVISTRQDNADEFDLGPFQPNRYTVVVKEGDKTRELEMVIRSQETTELSISMK